MKDLDEIFKKVKKPIAHAKAAASKKVEATEEIKKSVKKKLPDDDFADSRGKNKRRRTEDGLLIYSAEELNVGKGGDTDDCPFDCWCCF
jgi:hypothetical protein